MALKEEVYKIVRKIPRGKVASYGQIAALAGNKKAARAVGTLMKNNPFAPQVPCHRVVGKNGDLVGYTPGGIKEKRRKLLSEGVIIKGNRINPVCFWKHSV